MLDPSHLLYPPSFQAILAQLNSQQQKSDSAAIQPEISSQKNDKEADGNLSRIQQVPNISQKTNGDIRLGYNVEDRDSSDDCVQMPTDLSTKSSSILSALGAQAKRSSSSEPVHQERNSLTESEKESENEVTITSLQSPAKSSPRPSRTPSPIAKQDSEPRPPKSISVVSDDVLRNDQPPQSSTALHLGAIDTFKTLEACKSLNLQTLEEYRKLLERHSLEARLSYNMDHPSPSLLLDRIRESSDAARIYGRAESPSELSRLSHLYADHSAQYPGSERTPPQSPLEDNEKKVLYHPEVAYERS